MSKFSDYVGLREGIAPDQGAAMGGQTSTEPNWQMAYRSMERLFRIAFSSILSIKKGNGSIMDPEKLAKEYREIIAKYNV